MIRLFSVKWSNKITTFSIHNHLNLEFKYYSEKETQFQKNIQIIEKKRSFIEIIKNNSRFCKNNFKVLRITATLYEKEIGKKVNKDKIISNDPRSFARNQNFNICKIKMMIVL